ncbi:hypothetical protein J4450_05135 [Candidatus Micrarchaeota archaeon]|nr:hypothetical protein [Candidatus Micrarchaeota archaeon]
MNLLEYFFSFFKGKPKTKEEELKDKIWHIEVKRAEVMLKLAREKEKHDPDILRIDKYEQELAVLDTKLSEIQSK